jgi:hypothetical protein
MSLELTCKLKQLLPEQTGNGKNGPWVKQDFLVETQGEYPKTICMSAWGDMVKTIQGISPGSMIKASIRIESREFNSRWYTDVRPWKIVVESQGASAPGNYQQAQSQPAPTESFVSSEADDLPF